MCICSKEQCYFLPAGGVALAHRGKPKLLGVNPDVPPQLHYLPELMKLLVTGFSAAVGSRTCGRPNELSASRTEASSSAHHSPPSSQRLLSSVVTLVQLRHNAMQKFNSFAVRCRTALLSLSGGDQVLPPYFSELFFFHSLEMFSFFLPQLLLSSLNGLPLPSF